jgi:CBS domain-containing protein
MNTAEDILNELNREIIHTSPDTTLKDALKIMVEKRIGSIVVKEGEEFKGIWTERDLMRNVLEDSFELEKAKLRDHMTTNIQTAPYDSSFYKLYDIFLGKRFRHLFIEKNSKIIGIISIGDVIKANLNKKSKELNELNKVMKLEYYENWKFKKKQ